MKSGFVVWRWSFLNGLCTGVARMFFIEDATCPLTASPESELCDGNADDGSKGETE